MICSGEAIESRIASKSKKSRLSRTFLLLAAERELLVLGRDESHGYFLAVSFASSFSDFSSSPSAFLPSLRSSTLRPSAWSSLHEHLEGLRHAGLGGRLALDDRLVHLGAALHVVGLDGQKLLQHVRGAVALDRPDFHFAEALAAELRLAAERLARDEAVRSGRTGVDLVFDEVGELQDVHVADR